MMLLTPINVEQIELSFAQISIKMVLTPKIDELLTLSNTIDIPIRCMLRPHSNSFIYDKDDLKKNRKHNQYL